MDTSIHITPSTERQVLETRSLPFGKIPTEHMFQAVYSEDHWHSARIVPFEDLTLSPLALCLHYGQTVFEGLKAFRQSDGRIQVFRLNRHAARFSKSLERMCMPQVSEQLFHEAIMSLVRLDSDWVPQDLDGSLYLRPFMIATEPRIGVKVSDEYLFMVVATPAYSYYNKPLRVKLETNFSRAAEGGTGYAKCGGNYGGAFLPTRRAAEEGFDQVIWTDAKSHYFIEESGTMNLMFYWNGRLRTPPLSSSILDGVTRDSLLHLAKDMGIPTETSPIAWHELESALAKGEKLEAFGAGTAAVVAPISTLSINGNDYTCYTGSDAVMFRLRDRLNEIRRGLAPDPYGWNHLL
ncbi:MAG: branched-chain amino acid aminotransferase [Bacteroidetes bacterium]|nr:branched-chain amino acid aminotransferase [Bacteroidota bacterium]